MKKEILSLAICLWIPIVLFGQSNLPKPMTFIDQVSMPVHARLDYSHLKFENPSSYLQDDNRFNFNYFKIDVHADFNPSFQFNFRWAPVVPNTTNNDLSGVVQIANIHYFSKNNKWLLSFGKDFVMFGTAEEQYYGADVYAPSIVDNNLEAYMTGVTIQYTIGNDQHLGYQLLNGDELNTGNLQSFENNLYWFGNIGKLVKTYFSATAVFGETERSTPYTLNAGFKWRISEDYRLDTDFAMAYNMVNFYEDTYYYSIPIQLARIRGKWSPLLKYSYNIVKPEEPFLIPDTDPQILIETAHVHMLGAAIQYYPYANRMFRFHLETNYSFDQDVLLYNPSPNDPGRLEGGLNAGFQIQLGFRIGLDLLHGLMLR